MIYLVTGVPGAGKTLYALSTLVDKLLSEKIKHADGTETERRLVIDGIPHLVKPHELMAPADDSLEGQPIRGQGDGVWNWYEWCKPGDLLVIDEVQRHWRPRGMSTKPPQEIKMLETHRHLGVDFVIITQNPMLIDQNVRRLVGRHQHIRRLFGMARAVIYDWDGCSVDVNRTKSASTSMWGYPKKAYALYKSSELHTKQKQKIPAWLALPVVAAIGFFAVAPQALAVLSGAATGKGIAQKADAKTVTAPAPLALVAASAPASSASSPVLVPLALKAEFAPIEAAGCIVVNDRCSCFTSDGKKISKEPELCKSDAGVNGIAKAVLQEDPPAHLMQGSDAQVFAHLRTERQRAHIRPE